MSATTLLQTLFAYKAWANQETITAISRMDADAEPKRYKLSIRLLNHTHVVDCIFAAHLTGQAHGFSATNTPETPTIEELKDKIAKQDAWLIEYASSATNAMLEEKIDFTFTDGKAGRMSREEMLAHLITHGAYHRGQIGRIVSEVKVAAPRDILTGYLHLDSQFG